ncbi:hypothetical protein [Aureimonas sp. Leaf324]|uniref:hypothetical protein n=1 Tax=Aureimonas sp. Leaf324 TaxID=1736336 RepID=UPI0006F6F7F7|nr:hypothetical protein [Aureimonas sp. Leaf324]KQQ86065.1 hypothetical protein ASF65_05970 [Aureimonas sp. Leaf324]
MLRSSKGDASAVAERARYSCRVRYADLKTDLDALIEKAVGAVAASSSAPDAILGDFLGLASRIRAVSFHEGRLLEQAIAAIGQRNPDLVVLSQALKLPVTPAALEAVAHNRSGTLKGLSFDADARTRLSYTPDLVLVNQRYASAIVLDVKRSVASYLDTHRLTELKTKMLATSLILPDWLYKEHKRLTVDSVGIAIVDGASGKSDHANGIWSLSEIDDLLEIDSAADAMTELRGRFGTRIRALLEAETRRLVGTDTILPPNCIVDPTTTPYDDEVGDGSAFAGFASANISASSRSGNHFRADRPPLPRDIRFGFARARLHH